MSNSYNVTARRAGPEGVLACCWGFPADLFLLDQEGGLYRTDAASKTCRPMLVDLVLQQALDAVELKSCEVHLRPGHEGLLLLLPGSVLVLTVTGKRDATTVSLVSTLTTGLTLISIADFHSIYK